MTIENLGTSIDKISPAFHNESASDNFANRRGMEVQQNLCKLLGALDYVLWVRETKKDSLEDRQKIDLIVGLDQIKKGFSIPEVSVQVKASTTGVATFKREVVRILKRDKSKEKMSREKWMLEHRIVLLAGDLHISRSRKKRWPITKEEIIASFESQLKNIDDYGRSQLPEE